VTLPTLRPHPQFAVFSKAVARRKPKAAQFRGAFYRAVQSRHSRSKDIISGEGSRLHGARWNPPHVFRAVYGNLDPASALMEALALQRYYGVDPAQALPLVVAACEADLECLLDLTDPAVLSEFGVSVDQMAVEDWRKLNANREEALTQAIGRAAAGEGVEGLLVPSFAVPDTKNIVVFPELVPAGRALRAGGIDP
jgi:RES domain-containing protein